MITEYINVLIFIEAYRTSIFNVVNYNLRFLLINGVEQLPAILPGY
jgi:hypothetical protein